VNYGFEFHSRGDISHQVLCDSIDIVLRVITKVLLEPQSLSVVDWGLKVYETVAEVATNPDLTDRMLCVYNCIVATITVNTQDASIADALATALPTFLQQSSHTAETMLPHILNTLVSLSPSVFTKWLVPHFMEMISDLQKPDLEFQMVLLKELYQNHSEMVTSLLQEMVATILQLYVNEQTDCMMYRHVIAFFNMMMRVYPLII